MESGLRHLHERRHSSRPREPRWKHSFDYVMYVIATLAPLALLPQVLILFKTQDATSLSLPSFVLLGLMNVMWITYGLIHNAKALALSSALFLCFYAVIVSGIVLYS